jgi:hypothetical protein
METSLKNLLNHASTISGMNKNEKKQAQKNKEKSSEDCTKNLISLPSSVLSENFSEKIKKENLQKLANAETSQKAKKNSEKEKEANFINNPLKYILNENLAKDSASKNSVEAKKVNFFSADEMTNKLFSNSPIKNLNVSSIEYTAEEVSKLNLNNSLAHLLNFPAHSNSKNNQNLISLNNNNLDKNSNENLNSNATKNEAAHKSQSQKLEFNAKSTQSNKIAIPDTSERLKSKPDSITEFPAMAKSVQNSLLNSEGIIPEETLTVVPKPKNMKIKSYIEREVDIYSNLYPVKLIKNYCLYTYYLDFQGDSEHFNTFLKRKIISKAYLDLIPIFGVYFFSGENFYATEKVKDVTNIISTYNKVKYSFLIRPVGDFFEMKDYDANNKNKSLFKNILELIYKDILKANPDVRMIKNMCGKKCTEKIVTSRDNKVLVIPAFSTKIMLLEAGIFLNVDNKNKILNGEDCLKLIKEKMKNPAKPSANEIKQINDLFREKIIETKHTNQRFKIDSVSFDRTPKNTNLTVDGKLILFYFIIPFFLLILKVFLKFEFVLIKC